MARVLSIVEIFEAQAAQTPGAAALETGELRWSYDELDRRANWLAHALLRRGVGAEVVAALAVEPSPEFVLGLLGIWKAGGACLPIDPRWGQARIDQIRRDATPSVFLDGNFGFRDGMRADRPARAPRLADLACLVYTHAPRPLGVEIEHRGIVQLHQAQRAVIRVRAGDRVPHAASTADYPAIAEVLLALGAGATLCLAPRAEVETLPANLQGTSETGPWATSAAAVPGATVQILDRDLNPVPVGGEGELCIGGAGLARGYRNDRAETARRFVVVPAGRFFRTGERARRLADGSLQRCDQPGP
jgi:non-ribosomal peptide synthetase component F